ncbi:MAG: PAS domain S-box protein, partial [Betaproteobacteria bacterium]
MKVLDTLVQRARQFGVGRSIAVYLVIVIGLALACELAIDGMGVDASKAATPLLTALGIAALVGGFVFFLFHGAVEDRERAGAALAASEGRFRSLTSLSADWFWETDADHRLNWIAGGESMLKLFGASLAYGQRPWEIGGVVASPGGLAQLQAALVAGQAFHNLELSRPGEGGGAAWHLISGEPHTDAAGLFRGYRGVGRDITEMKNAARALSSAKDRLEMALDAGAVVIWESDVVAGRMILGEGWPRLLGEPATSRNLPVSELIERVHVTDRAGVLQASKRAVRGETASFSAEVRVRTATGNWTWVEGSGRVVERDAAGRALRMTGTAVDIDRRKRAEDAMRDAEARYRTLADLSPDAILLQSEGRIEYVNRAATAMLGASPAMLLGRDSMSMVHPEDRDFVLERALYLRSGPGKSDFRERRMIRPDGGVVAVEGASVSYLERGRLVIQTVLRDISDKVRAREDLAEREQRFSDVVEAAGEYVWETDAEFRYTWLSGRIEAVLGYPHSDLVGRRPHDFMPLGEARVVGAHLARHRERAEAFRDLVHRSVTKSGRVVWQSISGIPVRDGEGRLKGYRGTGADITARRQAEERIQYLATRDALTGLPNRLLLADRAQQAILNAGRHKGRIAVLSLHLDRFERVSETLGHRIGDAVLRAAAERLANTLRRDDTLARVGGEEFVLLWDGTRALD